MDDTRRLGPPLCRTQQPDRLGAMVSGDVQSQRFRCPRFFGEDPPVSFDLTDGRITLPVCRGLSLSINCIIFFITHPTQNPPPPPPPLCRFFPFPHKVHAVVRILVAQPATKCLILQEL